MFDPNEDMDRLSGGLGDTRDIVLNFISINLFKALVGYHTMWLHIATNKSKNLVEMSKH